MSTTSSNSEYHGPERRRDVKTLKKWSRVYRVWIVIFTIIVFWTLHENRQLAQDGTEARHAICTLKEDFRGRIKQGERFLRENPNGIPGIPAETLRSSIENQRRTLNALKINCNS